MGEARYLLFIVGCLRLMLISSVISYHVFSVFLPTDNSAVAAAATFNCYLMRQFIPRHRVTYLLNVASNEIVLNKIK